MGFIEDILQTRPIILAGSILLILVVLIRIYNAYTSPLSRLPGPSIARWTSLRLVLANVTGERVRYVHSLHEQYGRIVRIAPNEVSLCDSAAVKTIYKVGSPYLKSPWYIEFAGTGGQPERSLFNELDPYKHGQHRRYTAFNFSENWIGKMEPCIARNVQLAVQRMDEDARARGYFDAFKWFTFMATDAIGECSFGESFRMLETGKKNQYIHDLESIGNLNTLRVELPWMVKVLQYLPLQRFQEAKQVVMRIRAYSNESIERYWRLYRADPENVKPTLLTKEYAGVEDGTMTMAQLVRDGVGNIVAGTDTTAMAATNAVWLLSQHPEIEQEVVRAVSELPTEFTDADLRQLSVLDNVIHETLRLYASVSQSLPRIVPPGGAEFCGHFIPEGTTIGIQAWSVHRDPAIWTNPDKFDPARWDNPTKEMRDSWLPFGGGSRVCIGSHFAQLELRHALANFYRTFEGGVKVSTADGFRAEEMTLKSYFLLSPAGKRALLERRK